MSRVIPAPISQEQTRLIEELTIKAYRILDCRGVARVDYIIDNGTGQVYLNEINTIPGSMAFHLWQPKGVGYKELIDRMVECAFCAHADKGKNHHAYKSNILQNVRLGGKAGKKG